MLRSERMAIPLKRFMERKTELSTPPRRRDPYRSSTKLSEPARCRQCGAEVENGRWVRHAPPPRPRGPSIPRSRPRSPEPAVLPQRSRPRLKLTTCPACQQKDDHYAQGVVELRGRAWTEQQDDVFRTIQKTEKIHRARNDQERIMELRQVRNIHKVYVTLPELARQIGRELGRAFKGKVTYQHGTEEPFLRVIWDSDAGATERRHTRHPRSRGRKRKPSKI